MSAFLIENLLAAAAALVLAPIFLALICGTMLLNCWLLVQVSAVWNWFRVKVKV